MKRLDFFIDKIKLVEIGNLDLHEKVMLLRDSKEKPNEAR